MKHLVLGGFHSNVGLSATQLKRISNLPLLLSSQLYKVMNNTFG